jgi:hypothetical protein
MTTEVEREFSSAINTVKRLLDSRILWNEGNGIPPVYYNPVLTTILINMRDLLAKCEKHCGQRVDFKDDVLTDTPQKINDVTDLIVNFRDAACHNDSFKRKYGGSTLAFLTQIRSIGPMANVQGRPVGSRYSDDVAFIMGVNVLYLKRHLERAFQEIKNIFSKCKQGG